MTDATRHPAALPATPPTAVARTARKPHTGLRDGVLVTTSLALALVCTQANAVDAAYMLLYLASVLFVRLKFAPAGLSTPGLLLHLSACVVLVDNANKICGNRALEGSIHALLDDCDTAVWADVLLVLAAAAHALFRKRLLSLLVVLNVFTSAVALPLEVGKNVALRAWFSPLPPGHVTQFAEGQVFVCTLRFDHSVARGVYALPCDGRRCDMDVAPYAYRERDRFEQDWTPDCNYPDAAAWILKRLAQAPVDPNEADSAEGGAAVPP